MIKLTRIRLFAKEASVNSPREFEIDTHNVYIRRNQICGIVICPLEHKITDSWQFGEIINYCKEHNISSLCRISGKNIDISEIIVDETIEELIKTL